jgi:hypothetical protein
MVRKADYVYSETEGFSSMFWGTQIYVLCSVRYKMEIVLVLYSFRRITPYVKELSLNQTLIFQEKINIFNECYIYL